MAEPSTWAGAGLPAGVAAAPAGALQDWEPTLVARQPSHREGENSDDPRERARPEIARAEHLHPEMEQHVVQRRGPVVAQKARDQVQWGAGDVDRERLVEPHGRRRPEPEHDRDDKHGAAAARDDGALF